MKSCSSVDLSSWCCQRTSHGRRCRNWFTRDGVCQSSTKPFKDDSFLVYILGELQHTDESHICSLMFTWLCDELLMFCSLSIKVSANCIKTDFFSHCLLINKPVWLINHLNKIQFVLLLTMWVRSSCLWSHIVHYIRHSYYNRDIQNE